jgi:hypothetical protein
MICAITPAGRGSAPLASAAPKYSAVIHADRRGAEIISPINQMDANVDGWFSCTGDDVRPTGRRSASNGLHRTRSETTPPAGDSSRVVMGSAKW